MTPWAYLEAVGEREREREREKGGGTTNGGLIIINSGLSSKAVIW